MSLYTFAPSSDQVPGSMAAGLRVEESADIVQLSVIADLPAEEVRKRLANGNQAFVAYADNFPAAFGWMARDKARIGELNHEFILPAGNRYLWNFRTHEAFRRRGIYRSLLQYILQNGDRQAQRFWIIHAPENTASLIGIQRAGFEYVGRMYVGRDGKTYIQSGEASLKYREQLEYMDINLSSQPAASCWNCSSPYLKKRKDVCCCATEGSECNGDLIPALNSR